jgi:hypothetical protein
MRHLGEEARIQSSEEVRSSVGEVYRFYSLLSREEWQTEEDMIEDMRRHALPSPEGFGHPQDFEDYMQVKDDFWRALWRYHQWEAKKRAAQDRERAEQA